MKRLWKGSDRTLVANCLAREKRLPSLSASPSTSAATCRRKAVKGQGKGSEEIVKRQWKGSENAAEGQGKGGGKDSGRSRERR